jgi:hypothetical protein
MTFEDAVAITSPEVVPHRGASFTTYKVTGTLDSVLKWISVIFDQYDPRGYGTKVMSIEMHDGGFEAKVWRSNSCD